LKKSVKKGHWAVFITIDGKDYLLGEVIVTVDGKSTTISVSGRVKN
jgi:hypothetical protein